MPKTTEPMAPKPWHHKAVQMAKDGYTRLQIAEAVDKDLRTVKALLSPGYRAGLRRRQRAQMARRRADPVWREKYNTHRRKLYAEAKRKAEQ